MSAVKRCAKSPVTPAVVNAFYEHHAVLRSLKQHPADHAVGHASLVFELVYPESLRAVREQGYIFQLLDFATDNPETARTFAALRAHMRAYLDGYGSRLTPPNGKGPTPPGRPFAVVKERKKARLP